VSGREGSAELAVWGGVDQQSVGVPARHPTTTTNGREVSWVGEPLPVHHHGGRSGWGVSFGWCVSEPPTHTTVGIGRPAHVCWPTILRATYSWSVMAHRPTVLIMTHL
jgi:hypothetical protein